MTADQTPAPPSSTPPPPDAPPPGTTPPKKGMSTGVKVAIGCGALFVLALIVLGIVAIAGGLFVQRRAEQFAGGVEAQQEASERLEALAREHPFSPPSDGVVGEDRADRFLAVTDDAWERMEEMEEWLEEMAEREVGIERRGRAGVGDVMAGMRGMGAWAGARLALVEALDEHDMSAGEYAWTGLQLVRAYESLDRPAEASGVPPENLAVAAKHRDEIAEIADAREAGEPSRGLVLWLALSWGLAGDAWEDVRPPAP